MGNPKAPSCTVDQWTTGKCPQQWRCHPRRTPPKRQTKEGAPQVLTRRHAGREQRVDQYGQRTERRSLRATSGADEDLAGKKHDRRRSLAIRCACAHRRYRREFLPTHHVALLLVANPLWDDPIFLLITAIKGTSHIVSNANYVNKILILSVTNLIVLI